MNLTSLPLPMAGIVIASLSLLLCTALAAETPAVQEFSDGTQVRKMSPPPKPGVHPRIFLSPEDLPTLREMAQNSPARKAHYQEMRKNIADRLDTTTTPEGKAMAVIKEGKTPSDAQFAAATELSYLLALAGIDSLITNDKDRGALLARALTEYGQYQLKNWVRKPDPVGLGNSFDPMICLAYDFIAPWMSETERKPVRQFIAKMSDGIHIFTWNMPERWRMWNWAGLHVYQGWGSLAIEGEPGYKPQLWNEAKKVATDFSNNNIHPSGALTEDLTYFTLGFEGTGLVLTAMAKRGDAEVLDKANISKLKYHLVNQLYPWGGEFQSHADGCGSGFYTSFSILKYLYPTDPLVDFAWKNRVGTNYDKEGPNNDGGIRRWVKVLFNTEYSSNAVTAEQLKQPLTYFCPDRGYLIARTGWDSNALKMDFEAKQDYPIVGHNHADANNFNLDALGRPWVTDTGYHEAGGHQHNEVMIDGLAESPWPCPQGRWVDLIDKPEVTIGVSDAKRAYDYHWSDTGYSADNNPPHDDEKWEKETDPKVMAFYEGQENRKTTGIFDHWSPFLLRSVWNPVEKAFRTAALVRGKHPYLFIVDDMKKDDAVHLYEWIIQMPDDVEVIKTTGDSMILGAKTLPPDPKSKDAKPQPDKRRLLVKIVDVDTAHQPSALAMRLENFVSNPGKGYEPGSLHKRLTIPARAVDPSYKVLLYPFTEGDPLPDVQWNEEHTACDINFPGQKDQYRFSKGESGRTLYDLTRNDQVVATIKAAPPAPSLLSQGRIFTDQYRVELALPGPDQEIRYTLDGSEPREDSSFYTGPFDISQTTTLKAATFARHWAYGDQHRSAITEATFTKQTPRDAVTRENLQPGVHASLYEGFWNDLPDFSKEKAMAQTVVPKFELPPETAKKGFGLLMTSYIKIPSDGVYSFGLKCDDAGKLWIDDQLVVDSDGPHVVQTRSGEIALKAGLHKITVGNCDAALPLGKGKGDGSWAFEVLWAPAGATLTEIPATMLSQDSGETSAASKTPSVAAQKNLLTEPGLDYTSYDRSAQVGTLSFLDVANAKPLRQGIRNSMETPDSSPKLLHVYQGYLVVPHPGVYEFSLSSSAIGEVTLGETVVTRVGFPEGNVAQSVSLEEGLVPYTVKLAQGSGLVRWNGPGQDWQPITADNVVRLARPIVSIPNQEKGKPIYEVFAPMEVSLETAAPLQSAKIIYTLDGTEPKEGGTVYDKPLTIDKSCHLRARFFVDGKPLGMESVVAFTTAKIPGEELLALWSADKFDGKTMANQVAGPGAASDLTLPDGTTVIDDPARGKALSFDHASPVVLTNPAILNNELTLSYWINTQKGGTLTRHGYAHFGIFLNAGGDGSVGSGGGGTWHTADTKANLINDGKWHHVAATFGGKPRQIQIFVDGVLQGSGLNKAPCITKELDFLQDYTGLLSEIRMYNRILTPEEIQALAKQ